MNVLAVPATDFARSLSDYLNQVQYRGQVFDIARGKKVIARLSPVSSAGGFPIDQLDEFLAQGPQLDAAERVQFAADIAATRLERVQPNVQPRHARDPWKD